MTDAEYNHWLFTEVYTLPPVCTPPAKNEEPRRVPPLGSGLGERIALRPFYMAAHITAPGGCWFTACRGRVRTFYPELVFSQIWERRA